jgi:hypothetical protein
MIVFREGTSIGRIHLALWEPTFSFLKMSPVEQDIDGSVAGTFGSRLLMTELTRIS